MSNTFPPRNLPGAANEWGRKVEQALEQLQNRQGNVESVASNTRRVTKSVQDSVVTATEAAAEVKGVIDTEVFPAIDEAAVSPVTDARLEADSLSIWPFVDSTIPRGALEPGAVEQNDIADFAISVKKLNSLRHHLY